jgi:hypothetical protein
MLMSRENPWQVASATIISMASHLLYTHCRPMLQPQAQVLQHVALGVTTLNCKPPLVLFNMHNSLFPLRFAWAYAQGAGH